LLGRNTISVQEIWYLTLVNVNITSFRMWCVVIWYRCSQISGNFLPLSSVYIQNISTYLTTLYHIPEYQNRNNLKHEIHGNNIYKFSSYGTENTLQFHYRDHSVKDVYWIIAAYSENRRNSPCAIQNYFYVKCIRSNYCALNG
jgi:hypothetical protein